MVARFIRDQRRDPLAIERKDIVNCQSCDRKLVAAAMQPAHFIIF
jgi:hypothetical protein